LTTSPISTAYFDLNLPTPPYPPARQGEKDLYRLISRVGTASEIDNPTITETQKDKWAIWEDLLEVVPSAFITTTELYSDTLNKSLGSHPYHPLYTEESTLSSSGSNASFAW
jgi:hypothetical protein